eukprot:TRINITY_DN12370_c1_g1_i1.p1 TRINITY_DN12370_c1_g1~~TRINITY_DN12370_c1_g1_i1.p1  ORF type:complete len:438 (+),score=68.23 TRINITY_DN12370_c1_g1_i1:60-1373(+)
MAMEVPDFPDDDEELKPLKKENKDDQILDTLDAEGTCIAHRSRGDVTEKGFWHRYVHVWVVLLSDSAVLMQKRSAAKKRFGGMWNCTSGFVMSGEPSLAAAKKHLKKETGMEVDEQSLEFAFTCKEISVCEGDALKQWIDIYILPLKHTPELHKFNYDMKEVESIEYITIGDLERAYSSTDPNFVLVAAPQYPRRLFQFLHKKIKVYLYTLTKIDSDEERQNKKGDQLLDTVASMDALTDKPAELEVIANPCSRNDVYNQSIWHRAVHVWLFDIEGGRLLLQQRSPKKRHFGGQWNCSTGHIKMGEPCIPTAVKSIKDDVGLKAFRDQDFELIFQAQSEMDTGGGCYLKQIVDVFLLTVPNQETYPEAPDPSALKLAKGEVDAAKYMTLDELEQVWSEGPSAHPDFVIPSGTEYISRMMYCLRRRYKKYHAGEPLSP